MKLSYSSKNKNNINIVTAFCLHYISQIFRVYVNPSNFQLVEGASFSDWNRHSFRNSIDYLLKSSKLISYKLSLLATRRKELLFNEIDRQIEEVIRNNWHLISYWDEAYPCLLRMIKDPPFFLYVRGNRELLKGKLVGVVGSRKASMKAKLYSRQIGQYCAEKQIVVVSGGAFGIDINAHLGAIESNEAECRTIVVLPAGIENLLPKTNYKIFNKIVENNGLFISERPIGSHCLPVDFIYRNRIISGISSDLIVVEAKKYSGAIATARYAAEQGRQVFVWHKPISDRDVRSIGGKQLLLQGARGFHRIDDLI